MANMINMHTMSASRDLVITVVVLLHRKLVELVGDVIGGANIYVPSGVNKVGVHLNKWNG
jgi:hypothetical protein